jgi:hypothetical protein
MGYLVSSCDRSDLRNATTRQESAGELPLQHRNESVRKRVGADKSEEIHVSCCYLTNINGTILAKGRYWLSNKRHRKDTV